MTTTQKLENMGFKHWQKNGMDRIYIKMDMDAEYDERYLKCFFNRYQLQNLKIYWDCTKNELVITVGSDEAKEAVTYVFHQMMEGNAC